MVRLRVRSQGRRRRFHYVLLQLGKRERKRCSRRNSPHRSVRVFLHFRHILHLFTQQRKTRIPTVDCCVDLHARLVYRARIYGNKRRFRGVRRVGFSCGIDAYLRSRFFLDEGQSMGNGRRKRSAYNGDFVSVFLLYAACNDSENIRNCVSPSRFLGQSVAILLSRGVLSRRFVYTHPLHRFLFCGRTYRRVILLRKAVSRPLRTHESALQKGLRRPLCKRRSGERIVA